MGRNMKIKYVIILCIASCAVGAILYPSKTIIKTVEVNNETDKKTIEELKKTVSSLENTNKRLSTRIHTIVVEHPDGTKRTETKTESDLYESKTKKLKEKFEKELAVREAEIKKLKEYNKTEINKKRFGVELGMLASQSYYVHINADIFGPVFLGIQTQVGNTNTLGAGVGIRL